MKYKQNRNGIEKCLTCGKDTDKVLLQFGRGEPMCRECYIKMREREKHMTEADYQTWDRL